MIRIIEGNVISDRLPFHTYLECKNLIVGELGGHWRLISIKGEDDFSGLCTWAWENCKTACGEYETLEDFIDEVNIGNDGFGFYLNEIKVIQELSNENYVKERKR